MKKLLARLFPLGIETFLNHVSHDNYIDGRWYRIDTNFQGLRWPKFVSNARWVKDTTSIKLCGSTSATYLLWPDPPLEDEVDDGSWNPFVPNLVFEGENLQEWLLENCKDEFACRSHIRYFMPWASPIKFVPDDALIHMEFLNPKDAMLFKMRFQ